MSQSQNIEEIMQRIRAQVRKQEPSGGPASAPAAPATQNEALASILQRIREKAKGPSASAGPGSASAQKTTGPLPPFNPKFHELSQLRIEIATTDQGGRQTGQLNPRNPGLINSLIQFAKKVMRRSLTWYTRPLNMFQGGVIRALQQIIAILDNQRDQIQKLAERFNLQVEANERSLASVSGQLDSQSASLQQVSQRTEAYEAKLQQASERADSAISGLEAKLQRGLEEALARNKHSELSERNAEQIETLKAELQTQRNEMQSLLVQMQHASAQQRVRERDMRRLVHAVEQSGLQTSPPASSPVPSMFPSEVKGEFDFDYFAFEEQYRGDEIDIRQRQETYLEYFQGRDNVVDIGCGRGEFLEILRDNGIQARGVELGTDQYLLCKEKGLDVIQQDLFAFLESVPDESLGGIFSAQVIEHMTASDQLRYVALAYKKTRPGSPVIFETINPECVSALVRNFFLDPTHVRPVHPETLKFAMESAKFRNVELRFSGLASEKHIPPLCLDGNPAALQEFNAALQTLNHLLYGFQDYAAIGWR